MVLKYHLGIQEVDWLVQVHKIKNKFLKLINFLLYSPPPFFWLNNKRKIIILGDRIYLFPLYIFQYLINITNGLRKYILLSSRFPNFNNNLLIYCTLINSFTLHELTIYKLLNIDYFDIIKNFVPGNLSIYLHSFNRRKLINKCKNEKVLLSDKYKTLQVCPSQLNYKKLIINLEEELSIENAEDGFESLKNFIFKNGLVIKPRFGSLSKNIFIIKHLNSELILKKIHSKNDYKAIGYNKEITIKNLLNVLYEINYPEKEFLISPYFRSYPAIDDNIHNLVIRIVTQMHFNTGEISIYSKWIEVHFSENKIIFIDMQGNFIPKFRNQLSEKEKLIIAKIKDYIIFSREMFKKAIDGAKTMHSLVGSIDVVAWDFIPSIEGPKLLEGNSDFNIFLPQLFHYLKNKNINIMEKESILKI